MRIAVSDENVDVNKAKPKDMALDSDLFALKIFKHGQVTAASADPIRIEHNLGFLPTFLIYEYVLANQQWQMLFQGAMDSSYATETELILDGVTSGSRYSYFIFVDNAEAKKSNLTKKEGYQILVSQPGKDVGRGEPAEMSFDSNYPSLKIYKSGEISLTTSAVNETKYQDIPHDLKYAPAIYVLVENAGYYSICPINDLDGEWVGYSMVDKIRIGGKFYSPSTHIFKYFIFRDEL